MNNTVIKATKSLIRENERFDISVHEGGVKSGNLHNIAWSLHHRRERCDNDWKDRTESSNLYSYCLANRTATTIERLSQSGED